MTYHARVTPDGEVIVPAEMVRALGLAPGDKITLDQDGQAIVLKTVGDIVREGQLAYRAMIKRPFSLDDFIADRRAEAERE